MSDETYEVRNRYGDVVQRGMVGFGPNGRMVFEPPAGPLGVGDVVVWDDPTDGCTKVIDPFANPWLGRWWKR